MINRFENISDILDPALKKTYEILDTITLEDVHNMCDKYYDLSKFNKVTDKDIK